MKKILLVFLLIGTGVTLSMDKKIAKEMKDREVYKKGRQAVHESNQALSQRDRNSELRDQVYYKQYIKAFDNLALAEASGDLAMTEKYRTALKKVEKEMDMLSKAEQEAIVRLAEADEKADQAQKDLSRPSKYRFNDLVTD